MADEERNEYSSPSKNTRMADMSPNTFSGLEEHFGRVLARGLLDSARPSLEVEVIDCDPCGYAHVVPLPDPADVEKFYIEKFYTVAKPDYFKERKEDKDWWDDVYDEIFRTYDRLLDHKGSLFLDYGCGPGYMMARAMNLDWDPYGVECSPHARDYFGQTFGFIGSHIYPSLEDVTISRKFDAANIYEVLEHVREPLKLLKELHGALADGGILSVVVPNDFNPLQMRMRAHAWPMYWVSPVEHLNYFTKATLSRLLHKSGFKIEKITTTFPMEFFLLMGDDYTSPSKPGLGRVCHKKRILFEDRLGPELKAQLYSKFASMNIGREIIAYARKI